MTKDEDLDVAMAILGRFEPDQPAQQYVEDSVEQGTHLLGNGGPIPTNPLIAAAIGVFRALQAGRGSVTPSVPPRLQSPPVPISPPMTAEEREAAEQDGATRRSRSLAYPSPPETSLTALC
jgi:hypothetical protein